MPPQTARISSKPDLLATAEADYVHLNGALRINKEKAWQHTAFSWPEFTKWQVLVCVFIAQISMNFNASIYANAVPGLKKEFGIDNVTAKIGQWLFLILYGFGCELWAPFSEEFGRKPIMQWSLWLVNLCQLPCIFAPNATSVFVGRALGGLSSAGGSVTLGICADMYLPQDQQYAVAFVVLASVSGSVVGPIVGGFITEFADWRWVFWVQLIFGVVTALIHLFFCPETDPGSILDAKAKQRRCGRGPVDWRLKRNAVEKDEVYGPREKIPGRFGPKKILTLMWRPYWMLLTEPIVLFLSLLSGFSDALIFSFLDSYGFVFSQWNFNHWQLGLCFVPLIVGYIFAYFSFFPFYRRQSALMKAHGAESLRPETRLYWLLWLAPLEAIGLFAFGALSLGPAYNIPWIAPLLASTLVGIANYAIYLATIDYMVAAYGHYSASATGGNGFSRDVLAGVAALYTAPFYENLSRPYHLQKPTWIFACLAIVVIIPLYVFYAKGEWFRDRSKFANEINEKRKEMVQQRDREIGAGGAGDPGRERAAAAATAAGGGDMPSRSPVPSISLASTPAMAQVEKKDGQTVTEKERNSLASTSTNESSQHARVTYNGSPQKQVRRSQ